MPLCFQFTVTKVTDSEHRHAKTSITRLSAFDTITESNERLQTIGSPVTSTDTLTSSSITALLSSKWRVSLEVHF